MQYQPSQLRQWILFLAICTRTRGCVTELVVLREALRRQTARIAAITPPV
jgi:hypothetical protein